MWEEMKWGKGPSKGKGKQEGKHNKPRTGKRPLPCCAHPLAACFVVVLTIIIIVQWHQGHSFLFLLPTSSLPSFIHVFSPSIPFTRLIPCSFSLTK